MCTDVKECKLRLFSPIVTIMRPSWLEVEKATIFFDVILGEGQVAVNIVVKAPKHRHRDRAN